jgi:hypothetical protein
MAGIDKIWVEILSALKHTSLLGCLCEDKTSIATLATGGMF